MKRLGFPDLPKQTLPGSKVLVVDDDPGIRRTLERVVTDLGYRCTTAGSAEEADQWLTSASFDAVVLDIDLPRMNGVEFLRWALSRDPMLAILMLTGRDSPELALSCLDEGARTYFVKPFDIDFLGRALRDALQVRQLLLERNAGNAIASDPERGSSE